MAKTKKAPATTGAATPLSHFNPNGAPDWGSFSTQSLVNMGLDRKRIIEQYTADLKLIEKQLIDRPEFPGVKTEEEIETSEGTATRKVENSWLVDAARIDALKKKLGMDYPKYIKESDAYEIDLTKLDALRHRLGAEFDIYIKHSVGYSFTAQFRADVQKEEKSAFGKAMDKFIIVATKISIKWKPNKVM